jgi:uncharacterized protein (TIGR02145 family)
MKNFIIVLSAVLLVTAINACTLQEAPDSTTPGAITITAQTVQEQATTNVPDTKTTLSGTEGLETHWVGGSDQIGLFSPQAKPTEEGSAPTNNASFTAQTSAKSSDFSGTMFWGGSEDHNFYAYYPYDSGYSGDQTAVSISLPSAQSQSVAGNTNPIGTLDFMVAKLLTVPNGGAVALTFNHVFAMIEFQIKGSGTLNQISLNGEDPLAFGSGTIDLTQTPDETSYTITTTSSNSKHYVTVTLESPATLSSEIANRVYMMIKPGTQSKDLQIGLKINGNWKDILKTQPTGGFVRGKKYQVALNTADAGWMTAFKDNRDDKIYPYITIGEQVWLAENLAYLPSVVGPETGSGAEGHETDSYYYVYGYEGTDVDEAKATENYQEYGVIYNWHAAMNGATSSDANPSGVQGICPEGWHLPSDAEWKQLEISLGMTQTQADGEGWRGTDEGGKLKEEGTTHWHSPNEGATNSSGYTARPGGARYYNGEFNSLVSSSGWWSTSEYSTDSTWRRRLGYSSSGVFRSFSIKETGIAVRCIRD